MDNNKWYFTSSLALGENHTAQKVQTLRVNPIESIDRAFSFRSFVESNFRLFDIMKTLCGPRLLLYNGTQAI